MSGTGKLKVKGKAKRKHTPAFYVIGLFTFAIESMLGINAAFLIDQSIGVVTKNMLDGTPIASWAGIITLVVSLAVGACFICGGLWTFGGFMDAYQDAKAYQDHYGLKRKWPTRMVIGLELAIIAIDFTTLFFRASYFAEKGATALFLFFVILIFLPPLLGPLVYVLENTPRVRRLTKAYRKVEQYESDDVTRAIEEMDPDLRRRFLDGDLGALNEHYQRMEQAQQAAYLEEEQQAEDQYNKDYPLAPASLAQNTQASQRSSNQ